MSSSQKKVIILQKKNSEYDLKKNFTVLNCIVEEYLSLDQFLSRKEDLRDVLVLFDGKTFLEIKKDLKSEFISMYKESKLVLMGDFSESYLFSKALLEKFCKEFIVTPFGKREAENLIKRVYYND